MVRLDGGIGRLLRTGAVLRRSPCLSPQRPAPIVHRAGRRDPAGARAPLFPDAAAASARARRLIRTTEETTVRQAYIYDAVRTPRGRGNAKGSLHEVTAISL